MNTAPEQAHLTRRGQLLVLALVSATRTAGYYAVGNAVMRQVCAALSSMLQENRDGEGVVRVGVHSHSVYLNRTRVPTSVSTYGRFDYLIQLFDMWGISSLVFGSGLTDEELMRALVLLAHVQQDEAEEVEDMLLAQGVERLTVERRVSGQTTRAATVTPLVAYTAAMQLGTELGEVAGSFETGVVRRVRHVTQAVVDQIMRDPVSLLTLTTIKDFDRYLVLHSTNVAVLSTLLGQRLGLDKPRLGELCLAGFLHDAGKLGVDPDVLNKPGALDKSEWDEMRRHPILAAYTLLGSRRLNPSNMRAVQVAFEHHLNYDLSGYPAVELKDKVTLYGSIVAIADLFDALTTARVYRKVNPTPAEAIANLMRRRGTHFDPTLVKLFVEVMGVYPVGTVVALTGREAGVVCRPPAIGSPVDRPRVRLAVGAEPGKIVDLNQRVEGKFVRSVVAVLNPGNNGQIPAVDPATLGGLN
jgi:HD-GYP domain-containing protein (c-di-GMP phosphodiesterase class II)